MMRYDRCGDVFPLLPHDLVCTRGPGHEGPHTNGDSLWSGEGSAARRDAVHRAQVQASARAEHDARLVVLGQRPPRGGLVGNRQQRRAGLRRVR